MTRTRSTPAEPAVTPYAAFGGDLAENYQRYFVPVIPEPLAAELIELAAPRPGERAVDIACGTGVVTRLAAARVVPRGAVAGVDVNPGMLAVARSLSPAGAVSWHEGQAEALPLEDGSADLVLCQLGLMFVADRPAALREMRRVLVPGGRLALLVPGPQPPLFARFEDALARHLGDEAGAFVGFVFSMADAEALGRLVAEAGFRDVEVELRRSPLTLPPPADFLWQYIACTPLALAVEGLGEEGRAALEREVVEGWAPFTGAEGRLAVELDDLFLSARR
jgi:ubiquinone/menaquinone biosynthesis C-methylase UbiE